VQVTFVILWTIYLFLYFFEYGSAGDSAFWLSSYGVRKRACAHARIYCAQMFIRTRRRSVKDTHAALVCPRMSCAPRICADGYKTKIRLVTLACCGGDVQTLVTLIALGLSKYFTAAILAAVLSMVLIFIPITVMGFAAMESVSSPDRCMCVWRGRGGGNEGKGCVCQ